jgi:hypothetical protein
MMLRTRGIALLLLSAASGASARPMLERASPGPEASSDTPLAKSRSLLTLPSGRTRSSGMRAAGS